jgi:pyruvate kinase
MEPKESHLLRSKVFGLSRRLFRRHHKAENQMTRIKELQHIEKELEEAEKILADILNPQIRSSYDDDDTNRYLLVKPTAIFFF